MPLLLLLLETRFMTSKEINITTAAADIITTATGFIINKYTIYSFYVCI